MRVPDVTWWLFAVVFIARKAASLDCYKCASLKDPGCDIDWKVDTPEVYRVTCPDSATACQKIVGEIQGSGEQHVYRMCWERTNTEGFTPTGCVEDDIRGGHVCRCLGNTCNHAPAQHVAHVGLMVVFTFTCSLLSL